ncbi:MAG: L7Ae/L30e/S12e/Gadd45 family ribosomal protein [Eubacterium sp.]
MSQRKLQIIQRNCFNKCKYYKIPCFVYGSKQELGEATGNDSRASIAITDRGFSETINRLLES